MSIPNLITIGRILMVPFVVWAIGSGQMLIAFVLFGIAGVSDGVDGFLAKRFNMTSELGAFLDPLADKALLVSIYVALGIADALPRWLVILVVSRDILIIGGVMLAWFLDNPMTMRPHYVSKLNTAAQIVLAGLVLGLLGLEMQVDWLVIALMTIVGALTSLSAALYVAEWIRHMGLLGPGKQP